jgi:hypothetical protein
MMTGGGREFAIVLALLHGTEGACWPHERRDAPAFYFCVQHIKVKGEVVGGNHVGGAQVVSEETDDIGGMFPFVHGSLVANRMKSLRFQIPYDIHGRA